MTNIKNKEMNIKNKKKICIVRSEYNNEITQKTLDATKKPSIKVINRDGINLNTKGELHNFLYPLAMLSSSTIFKVSQM